jgi:hypothetical protein
VVFGVDVDLERSHGSIAASWAAGGDTWIDVLEHRPGADWIPDRMDELAARWARPPVYGVHGPATATLAELRRRGHDTHLLSARGYGTACQGVIDAITDNATLWHPGKPALSDAVKVAATREAGGVLVWSRAGSAGPISALVAATAARMGALELPPPAPKPVVDAG